MGIDPHPAPRTAGAWEVLVGARQLPGRLATPEHARGLVIFAHGSGSSRLSPRNAYAAERLRADGLATLLFDLLSEREGHDRRNVFNIALLAERVADAVDWARADVRAGALPIGLFGASTGAAAAIVAATMREGEVAAVVSRGGRPDLAGAALAQLAAPTLLIVGGEDRDVIALNQHAQSAMRCRSKLVIIPGAGHLFEEPGTLEAALDAASGWFRTHLDETANDRAALS
jgi:pimeloyl-ACP methyl ester carboxylesterase